VQPSTALGALRRRLPEDAPGARARARRRRARREEGALAFWKGNSANVVRIFPYSAAQLMSNDYYKRLLAPPVRRAPPPAQASAAPPWQRSMARGAERLFLATVGCMAAMQRRA